MGNYITDTGFIGYVRSGLTLSSTHGGSENLHLMEFEEVANVITDEKINKLLSKLDTDIPRIIEEYGTRIIDSVMGALSTDIDSIVKIGLSNCGDIFYGEKAQRYISRHIAD